MDGYIKFYAGVNPNTSIQLQRLIEQLSAQGMDSLHLLLSTPGGSVHDGISLYNLLKGLPIAVNTYNFGSVDSIGVVIFCAGTNRYSVPNARFLLHPVSMMVGGNQVFDEPAIGERLKLLKADETNIANVIASTILKTESELFKIIHNRTTLNPEEAKTLGLVTEIKTSLVPAGVRLNSIYDNQLPQQQQIQIPLRGITIPQQQGLSSITDSYTSI